MRNGTSAIHYTDTSQGPKRGRTTTIGHTFLGFLNGSVKKKGNKNEEKQFFLVEWYDKRESKDSKAKVRALILKVKKKPVVFKYKASDRPYPSCHWQKNLNDREHENNINEQRDSCCS